MDDITLCHICDEKEILLVHTSKVVLITTHMHLPAVLMCNFCDRLSFIIISVIIRS